MQKKGPAAKKFVADRIRGSGYGSRRSRNRLGRDETQWVATCLGIEGIMAGQPLAAIVNRQPSTTMQCNPPSPTNCGGASDAAP
ncbi:uncharacterized protein UV8b_04996 [Ustilaginoidea virens]|uniref:Uncharacterized protein n=1 Tax=Ustilaginoidea virens TaxID=1159556 RepID=A0A8E5HSD2_USTVR|nr:uncharacterized protein UV8b_04996 [Ustilaginoidea virens]QUC20755.1 hypothetical protein UV8b_04996 [Ustilaginoidea virens]